MTFDVFASGFHRLCGPVELTAVHLKNVPEAVVYLQAGFYILTVRRFGQPLGIIQQNLLATHLDQQGRQAAQVAEYR